MMWIFVEELKFKLNKEWQAFVDWHIYPHFQEYKHQGLGKYAMNPLVKICIVIVLSLIHAYEIITLT